VLGIALGGAIAARIGWRWAFGSMALFGLVLALICFVVVRETRGAARPGAVRTPLKALFAGKALCSVYVASALQLFAGGACIVWMPSFMARYYGMGPDKAGATAALVVLASGAGMVLCGMLSDRMSHTTPSRKAALGSVYSLGSALLLTIAFALPHGPLQLVLIGAGMFLAAGGSGPAGAIVADLTPLAIHGTAFATLTLANNLLGLAPGPFVTGLLADHVGLDRAFQVLPLASLVSAVLFLYVSRHYAGDAERLAGARK
jgi:predicted MFS family arabinose efflux permease